MGPAAMNSSAAVLYDPAQLQQIDHPNFWNLFRTGIPGSKSKRLFDKQSIIKTIALKDTRTWPLGNSPRYEAHPPRLKIHRRSSLSSPKS